MLTFLAADGAAATVVRGHAADRVDVDVLVDEPELVVAAARGAVATHSDGYLVSIVSGGLAGAKAAADAYRAEGLGGVARLPPPFAAIIWDGRERRGAVVADRLGSRSIFTTRRHGGTIAAGEVVDLLGILPRRPAPDLSLLASWVAARGLPTTRTLYDGIDRVPGRFALRLGRGEESLAECAPLLAPPLLDVPLAELAPVVRGAVQRAVDARIPAAGVVGVLLSGGIDSATVAAAATRSVTPARVCAVSAIFPDRPDADESALIASVAERLGARSELLPIDRSTVFGPGIRFLDRWQLPPESPTMGLQLALQEAARSMDAAVLLDGEGGDELFGLRPYLIADELRHGRLDRAWRLSLALTGERGAGPRAILEYGLKGLAPARLHRLRPPRRPAWVRADAPFAPPRDGGGNAWKSASGPRWLAEGRDALTVQRERIGAHDYLRRRAALSGVTAAHPFLDDGDLVELALRLPPAPAFFAKEDRPVLRAATAGELPDEVRLRVGKSYFNHLFDAALGGVEQPVLDELLAPGAEIEILASRAFLDGVLATPPGRRRGAWTWTAWRLATAECWLRAQVDPAFADRLPIAG